MLSYNKYSLDYYIKKEEDKHMLTELIEENKITLVHAESSSGKTIWAIKHLNDSGIEPLLFDYDDNTMSELQNLNANAIIIDAESFFTDALAIKYPAGSLNPMAEQLRDRVIIIDTWRLFADHMGSEENAIEVLNTLTNKHGVTVIILSHSTTYASSQKNQEPDMDKSIYSHIKARLFIKRNEQSKQIAYSLIIEKIRGHIGPKIIDIRVEKKE